MEIERPIDEPLFPSEHKPDWVEHLPGGGVVGIAIDGGCFVLLARDRLGYWVPTTYIPPAVISRLSEIAEAGGLVATGRYRPASTSGGYPSPPPDEQSLAL